MQLILASSSRSRKKQLEQLNVNFSSISPDVDESRLDDENVQQLVKRLSLAKAKKIADKCTNAVIIAGDQVGFSGDNILGKPLTLSNNINQLRSVSNQEVTFYSGLCVISRAHDFQTVDIISTTVKFRPLTDKVIENYVNCVTPFHCAGGFNCEGLGLTLFDWIRSDDPSAIIGLPLITLTSHLTKLGFNFYG